MGKMTNNNRTRPLKRKVIPLILLQFLIFTVIIGGFRLYAFSDSSYDWYKTWGGLKDDEGWSVVVDSNGDIYLAGRTSSYGAGSWDAMLIKYTSNGTKLWYKTWGGSNDEYGKDIAVDSNNNIYLTGYTSSDAFLVKYNSTGTELWDVAWEPGIAESWGVAVDNNDSVYIIGAFLGDALLVKYNSSGTQLWNRTWGGPEGEVGRCTITDANGNIYIAGNTNSFGTGDSDVFLVKYNSMGIELWNCTWGTSTKEECYGITIDNNDNIYIVGLSGEYVGDALIVKYNSTGTELWYRIWNEDDDSFRGIVTDNNNNLYIAGRSSGFGGSDFLLFKYDSAGNQLLICSFPGAIVYDIAIDSSNNTYFAGSTTSFGAGGYDAFLLKNLIPIPSMRISGFLLIFNLTAFALFIGFLVIYRQFGSNPRIKRANSLHLITGS